MPKPPAHPSQQAPAPGFSAFGLRAEAEPIAPGLHVVATPIGNLGDVSFRALATLAAADLVVAEDTRVTKTLLAHYGVTTPLFAYHEHNADHVRPQLLARLDAGAALALVSDAGTPLVSDPGFRLVGDALARGIAVTSVPGPSAVLAGLVVAGLPTARFFFEGFLPAKSAARRQRIAALAPGARPRGLFEAARRTPPTLATRATHAGAPRANPGGARPRRRGGGRRRGSRAARSTRGRSSLPPPGRAARRWAYRTGHGAERVAALWLRLHGWRMLARRYGVKGGEIDLVARRGATIAFVEVKWRAALDDAVAAIDSAKRRRMARAARVFIARHGREAGLSYRADAVFCAPWRLPLHLPAIFELPLG